MDSNNILIRITNALAKRLNETSKLPRFIIILIGDDFEKIGSTQEASYLTVHCLVTEIF